MQQHSLLFQHLSGDGVNFNQGLYSLQMNANVTKHWISFAKIINKSTQSREFTAYKEQAQPHTTHQTIVRRKKATH